MVWFSLEEMTHSDTAKKYGIDNTPSEEIKSNIILFIETVLDPIREDWGGPITVSSGYRCVRLNKIVGGAENSGHKYGFCADLQVSGGSLRLRKFAKFVKDWMLNKGYSWDEIIFERSGGSEWVHFAWKGYKGRQRMKCFDIVK